MDRRGRSADAILCSDMHLREDVPVCRTDDFWTTQWKKVQFIDDLQRAHDCPVLHAGDLFHHWKPSPFLISQTIHMLPKQFHTVLGQHDLPQHQLDLYKKCGAYTLEAAQALTILPTSHFGTEVGRESLSIKGRHILVWHHMVWQGARPWPGCIDLPAHAIQNIFPQFDLILTGDNHKPFVANSNPDGHILVNPGSLTRQTADQADHQPRVYLWYADENEVDAVYLPIETNVVTREHIEERRERDERVSAFVEGLTNEWDVGLNFEANLDQFMKENKVRQSVVGLIRKAMETV